MAYSEYQSDRISNYLHQHQVAFVAKKMMGGLCFMVQDKMCLGLLQDKKTGEDILMARIGPDVYDIALQKNHIKPMDFTGRPMKGYVFVEAEGFDLEADLAHWVKLCLDFNPQAKSSKKN